MNQSSECTRMYLILFEVSTQVKMLTVLISRENLSLTLNIRFRFIVVGAQKSIKTPYDSNTSIDAHTYILKNGCPFLGLDISNKLFYLFFCRLLILDTFPIKIQEARVQMRPRLFVPQRTFLILQVLNFRVKRLIVKSTIVLHTMISRDFSNVVLF